MARSQLSVEPLNDADRAKLEKTLTAAVNSLKKLGHEVSRDHAPPTIIALLQRITTDASTLPSKPGLRAMGFFFAEQVHRAHGADWGVRCVNDDRTLFLYTKDKAICLNPSRTVEQAASPDMGKYFSLEGIFSAFGKVVSHGEGFKELLSPDEARHLFEPSAYPGAWPVWGVHWKLPPWP